MGLATSSHNISYSPPPDCHTLPLWFTDIAVCLFVLYVRSFLFSCNFMHIDNKQKGKTKIVRRIHLCFVYASLMTTDLRKTCLFCFLLIMFSNS